MKIWCMFFVFASVVYGDISSFFKPALNKTDFYLKQVDQVDFIYMINLDQRPEKYSSSTAQLVPYGIMPYRFSAVNGWELTLENLNQLGVIYQIGMPTDLWGTSYLFADPQGVFHEIMHQPGRNYFSHCMSLGAIGIVLSHLSVLQDAYDSGYETIWVMEDDIEVIRNPHEMSALILELDKLVGKNGWDLLFTDLDTKAQNGQYIACSGYAKRPNFTPKNKRACEVRRKISRQLRKIGARYGTYSMIVRRSGMEKLLDFFKKHQIFLPFDMDFIFPDGINLFTVLHDVVSTQPHAKSDNGSPNYKSNQPN